MNSHLNNTFSKLCKQEQVPTGTTTIVLRNLTPDTPYTVSVVPVYPAREGKRQSENGKTCKLHLEWTYKRDTFQDALCTTYSVVD